MKKIIFLLIMLFMLMLNGYSQDWPQFHGPYRNGVSDQEGIIRSWPPEGPEVLWSTPLGNGNQNWAPIALADGKLLIRDQGQMLCVKIAD